MVVGRKEETLGVSIRMSNAIYQSISLLRTGDEACSDGEKGIPQHLEAIRAALEKRGHMMPTRLASCFSRPSPSPHHSNFLPSEAYNVAFS
jgi:hypothetical protein